MFFGFRGGACNDIIADCPWICKFPSDWQQLTLMYMFTTVLEEYTSEVFESLLELIKLHVFLLAKPPFGF